MTSAAAAQDQRPSAATRVRSITVQPAADGSARVVIEADGALSPAESDALNGPPRIYFDFPGLLPAERGAEATDCPAIRRVRVALHSAEPRVTRVVIDLVRPAPHRIEPSGDPNRLVVAIGTTASATGATPAVPNVASPVLRDSGVRPHSAPEGRQMGSDPKPAPRASAAPFQQVVDVVDRFEKLRPLLVAIDGRTTQPGVNLQVAAIELSSIAKVVSGIKSSSRTDGTQGRLVQACALASQAIKARMEAEASGNPALEWTAASAAAGTLLLLDGARAELGLAPVTR